MRPRTKLQVEVFRLSQSLPLISKAQEKWAFDSCLSNVAYRTKTNVSCLDCGNIWDGPKTAKTCKCPGCGTKLNIQDTKKKNLDIGKRIIAITDVSNEFQVVRLFEIYTQHKAGFRPSQYLKEIVQQWFKPFGEPTIVAMVQFMGNSSFSGKLEIRGNSSSYGRTNYNLWADFISPKIKVLPLYKRNGFAGKLTCINPYLLFKNLLTDSKCETLIKAKQLALLSARVGSRNNEVWRYWDSIKICIRKGYIVKDSITWLDYLDLLDYFKKDLYNPLYVCPADLKKAHNVLVIKKGLITAKQRAERELRDAEFIKQKFAADLIAYSEVKGVFFGLLFKDRDLTIKVLESVNEFKEEGDIHQHCVFTNKYYNKKDSLIFSAQLKGKRVETVEVTISTMQVTQSRGLGNQPSRYHNQIIALMNKNLHQVKQRLANKPERKIMKSHKIGAVA